MLSYSKFLESYNQTSNKEIFVDFYNELCKSEKIDPIPVKFGFVGKLGGMLVYDARTKVPLYIKLDLTKLMDIEYTIYHEFAHQICLNKYGDGGHGPKFKKEFNRINDKYMYSKLSMSFMNKINK
jgi:hypothetical protein